MDKLSNFVFSLFLILLILTSCKNGSNIKSGDSLPTDSTETSNSNDTSTNTTNDTRETSTSSISAHFTGFTDIAADDDSITYIGRVDKSNAKEPGFAFPGVAIHMNFTGPAIGFRLRDNGSLKFPNFYYAIIDDGPPIKIEVSPEQEEYEISKNLDSGEHTIELVKLTESSPQGKTNNGKGIFLGFMIDKEGEVRDATPLEKTVEFIGDSITCGYGNELTVTADELNKNPSQYGYSTQNSNGYLAWGSVAAHTLNANYRAVAYSGRGITRNFAGESSATLPQMYNRIYPDEDDSPTWDAAANVPDIVVINLGTNDFSIGLDVDAGELDTMQESYRNDYIAFLKTLREYYSTTPIIVAIGPMMSDSYPKKYNAWTAVQEDLNTIVNARHKDGDKNVHLLILSPQTGPYGEDWHPTVETHSKMAQKLVEFISSNSLLK